MNAIKTDEEWTREQRLSAWLTQLRIWWCDKESVHSSEVTYLTSRDEYQSEEDIPDDVTFADFVPLTFQQAVRSLIERRIGIIMTVGQVSSADKFVFATDKGVGLWMDDDSDMHIYMTRRKIGYDQPSERLDIRDIDLFWSSNGA